ncbi:MAG: hypothetical protein EOM80_09245 [Erysipelotrichia bacterium]|nr:hypothetical protein [Erysipelotrichia bacterium]
MQVKRANWGFLTFVVFFLIIFGIVGLYLGYKWYNQKYYIALYDGNMTRYLDIPPFAERLTPSNRELLGECSIAIGTSSDQTNHFFKGTCDRYGYIYSLKENFFTIELRKNYVIKGEFADGKMKLTWTPSLNDKMKKRAQALFKEEAKEKKD